MPQTIEVLVAQGEIFRLATYLFWNGGWIVVFVLLLIASFKIHRIYKVLRYIKRFQWVVLAVDVPKNNEQTPRAVENIFAHLAGSHGTRDLWEKYFIGETQRWFSFEIVSIEGYIQFIIVTEKKHRDLVEALIYAQYPDAEITQIQDYCQWAPEKYPHSQYKAWGVEFRPVSKEYTNPIRTWDDFEDKVRGEYKDPMAALLETFTRIGKGEQLWMQILARPIGQKWVQRGIDRIDKITGKRVKSQTAFQKVATAPFTAIEQIGRYAFTGEISSNDKEEQKLQFGALILTPGDIATIKAINEKIGRIGFHVKIRVVYIAKNEVFNKNRVQHGLVGAMKQFTDETSNGLKPDTKKTQTTAHYFLTEFRKDLKRGKIVRYYKKRDVWHGFPRFIFNIRELATIWHFPMIGVKTPSLKISEIKTSRPPVELPLESDFEMTGEPVKVPPAPGTIERVKGAAPPNIPFA